MTDRSIPAVSVATPVAPSSLSAKPTTEQRVKIRNLLDHHFDDEKGIYLDGMSDRAIAEKLNVPAVFVRDIREAAYGPENPHPELTQMFADLAALKQSVADLETRLEKHIAARR